MQDYIDADGGGNGAGWYRIVTTPAEARAVVARGQLAVVLGVETANPPLWGDVRGASWLRANGVRHVFPIHVADNDLGGASYFQPKIQHQANNPNDSGAKAHWVTQRYDLTTMECPQYELASDPTSAIVSLNTGACNVKGLTDAGKAAVEQLMRAGLIIDVDHMSDRSFADTLTIAEKNGYPVVASHAGFNTINHKQQSHEGQLTSQEYARLLAVGGMVGVITGQGVDRDDVGPYLRPSGPYVPYPPPHIPIPNACGRSSQAVVPGPRFGSNACLGGKDNTVSVPSLGTMLTYPFLARGSGAMLNQMTLGSRSIDFNNEGLLTVGQLPDLLADLEAMGVTADELEPLFHSAETYIAMWERAEAAAKKMPQRLMTLSINGGAAGGLKTDVSQTFIVNAQDFYFNTPVQGGVVFMGNQNIGAVGAPITHTFTSTQVPRTCRRTHGTDRAGRPETEEECTPSHIAAPHVMLTVRADGFADATIRLQFVEPN
jgi:microsomal dipeptidase-like Zn-dependent dipeptidase